MKLGVTLIGVTFRTKNLRIFEFLALLKTDQFGTSEPSTFSLLDRPFLFK